MARHSQKPLLGFEAALQAFIRRLQRAPHDDRVFNPYRYRHLRDNLAVYLRRHFEMRTNVLLVGEALGFRGGRLTGLPFSSGKLILESDHPFWQSLRSRLIVKDVVGEATASIIWEVMAQCEQPPLMWNAFPFHPMRAGDASSNRMPTPEELAKTTRYFGFFLENFPLGKIVAVGKNADRALTLADIPHDLVRHPSRGGKALFAEGINRLLYAR